MKREPDEITRLRAENERLREALEPFSVMAGALFARNFNDGDILLLFGSSHGGSIDLKFKDFRRARKALTDQSS